MSNVTFKPGNSEQNYAVCVGHFVMTCAGEGKSADLDKVSPFCRAHSKVDKFEVKFSVNQGAVKYFCKDPPGKSTAKALEESDETPVREPVNSHRVVATEKEIPLTIYEEAPKLGVLESAKAFFATEASFARVYGETDDGKVVVPILGAAMAAGASLLVVAAIPEELGAAIVTGVVSAGVKIAEFAAGTGLIGKLAGAF